MQITLQQVGKRFSRQWIFRNVSTVFGPLKTHAITGNNGSGKSTLLQIIFGYQTASEGSVSYVNNEVITDSGLFYKSSVLAAPYLDFPDELTLDELMSFHFSFKNRFQNFSNQEIAERCGIAGSMHKQVKYFSSGMKQRLRLGLAFFSDVQVVLLDEPCSNLDRQGTEWYRSTVLGMHHQRVIVIASNQENEYDFADSVMHMDGTGIHPSR